METKDQRKMPHKMNDPQLCHEEPNIIIIIIIIISRSSISSSEIIISY